MPTSMDFGKTNESDPAHNDADEQPKSLVDGTKSDSFREQNFKSPAQHDSEPSDGIHSGQRLSAQSNE